jgi:hypothetical protein
MSDTPLNPGDITGWLCVECGYFRDDLEQKQLRFPMPCPRCGRGNETFQPHIIRRQKQR